MTDTAQETIEQGPQPRARRFAREAKRALGAERRPAPQPLPLVRRAAEALRAHRRASAGVRRPPAP